MPQNMGPKQYSQTIDQTNDTTLFIRVVIKPVGFYQKDVPSQ